MGYPTFSLGDKWEPTDANAVGLWKITSVNLSGTVTNIANCFTSSFTNYRIMVNFTSISANQFVYLQFSNGGVVDANANYVYATNVVNGVGATASMSSTTNTGIILGYGGTANTNAASTLDVFQPKVLGRTYGHSQRWEYDSANFVARTGGFLKDQITSFDGFAIGVGGANTLGGTIQVFGYRN